MTTQPLPERPNLEQLKHQAKTLLRSAREKDPAALARFRTLPAFAGQSDAALAHAPLALHDAQSVIAREHGFPSWNALRERVEELTLAFEAALEQFVAAATEGRTERAARLLALHPRIARASFHAALVLGDAPFIEARLGENPALATTGSGPRGWQPLHYVCHSTAHGGAPERLAGLAAIARRLLSLGADPNLRFPWRHHGVQRPVLWGAAVFARALPLAQVLLEAGASPNDGVTLPLAAAAGDLPVLELLRTHGVDVNSAWATDGSAALYAILHWAKNADGVRWLLQHGAQPDPVFAPNGETPLHVIARQWDAASAELFVRYGADPDTFDWRLVSAQVPAARKTFLDDARKRRGRDAASSQEDNLSVRMASAALSAFTIPDDILSMITERARPGASLIVSDRELPLHENGSGTEFVVLTK